MAKDDRVKDVESLRAFTNPLRLRLYYALAAEGVATATMLGSAVAQPPSLVSYHLHKLAAFGFIEEAVNHSADGRERWWRKSSRVLNWQPAEFQADPEQRDVSAAARQALASHQWSRFQQYLEEDQTWPLDWVGAAFSSDTLLKLTPREMAEFQHNLQQVVDKYAKLRDSQPPKTEERAAVMFVMHGFPFRP